MCRYELWEVEEVTEACVLRDVSLEPFEVKLTASCVGL